MSAEGVLDICERAVRDLRRGGSEEACASFGRTRGVTVEWRDGRVESVEEHSGEQLRVEVYRDGRYAAASTCDLRKDAVAKLLEEVVALTRVLERDPFRVLPDPALYARSAVELDLDDPSFAEGDPDARLAAARELEEYARAAAGETRVVSVTTAVSEGRGESARVHSNGFSGSRSSTHFSQRAEVTLGDRDGRRPLGHASCVRRHRADLEPRAQTARSAALRAAAQLGAQKLPTGRYTAVVENRVMGRLVGALLAPLSGTALYQRRSLWDGMLGKPIASAGLTLIDEPHLRRGLGSALWDGDGLGTRRRVLIEQGVLRSYLIDVYAARQLGVDATGGDLHNLQWSLGERSPAELLREVGDGVFIERFIGGNSNAATGAISLGCAGRWVRGGELTEPIAEFNLAANLRTLFASLAAQGNDPDRNGTLGAPTCVFEGIQLSGV